MAITAKFNDGYTTLQYLADFPTSLLSGPFALIVRPKEMEAIILGWQNHKEELRQLEIDRSFAFSFSKLEE